MVMSRKPCSIKLVGSVFIVKVILILLNLSNSELLVNASCVLSDGQLGQCVKFEECRSALISSRKGVNLWFCDLEEGRVCCTDFQSNIRDYQPAYSQKKSSNVPDYESSSIKGTYEDSNYQKKKHTVTRPSGSSSNGDNYGRRKTNYDDPEEPYEYETPGNFYSDGEVIKPFRQPNRQNNAQNDNHYFVPPGLVKKKPWREEKTTENDYFHEIFTKKPGRGPPVRKNNNKHTGNNYDTDYSPKPAYDDSTRRHEWFEQGGKRPNDNNDYYSNHDEYENSYANQRPTTKRNKWNQETYTTTRPYDPYHDNHGNYGETENEYSNVKPKPDYRPSVDPSFSQSHPSRRPQGNRPDVQNNSRPQENRPTYQQGFRPEGSNRPNIQQGSRPHENNRPNYGQSSGFDNNRPNSRPQKRRRISELKCEEYTKEVIENITGLPLTTNPDPVIISVRKCITPQQLIVGGENTTLGEFPHMAAVGFRDRNKKEISWNCGGTLISEQFVMTAAHCTSTSSGRPVKVRLGEYNLVKNDDGAHPVDYAVVDIITHPDYRPPAKYNDIALLKLSRKVLFFKHIRPACLYVEESFSGSKAIATGWGRMHYDGGRSEILQKVVLSIVDNITCNRLYKVNVKTEVLSRGIVDSQLCAGELTGEKDTCQGDSGGPLSITSTKCVHHVIGVTSFGKSCALPNSTGVYTRVSAYVPWIESVVWPN